MILLDRKWYNEDDFYIFYYYNDEPKDIKTKGYIDKCFFNMTTYKIVYLYSGDRIVEIENDRIKVSDGAVIIGTPNMKIGFERISNKTNSYLQIDIYPKVFNSIVGDNDFLRVFDRTEIKQKVFYPKEFGSQTCIMLIGSIIEGLDKHLGRIHMMSKVLSIISEMDVHFDITSQDFHGSDNFNVNLMGYIEKHFMEKITMEDVCKKFFISKTTLNAIVKQNTGITFLKYINYLRVLEAKRLISHTSLPLKRICEVCGFSDYSTFYREYKKYFSDIPKNQIRPIKF